MVVTRCAGRLPDGHQCRAWPLHGESFCRWHSPEREEEAAEARRLGGLRRRREKTLPDAYDFVGLGTVESIRRLLENAAFDALGLENSIARGRVLISAVMAAAKLLETGELEERVEALEAVHHRAQASAEALPESSRHARPEGRGTRDRALPNRARPALARGGARLRRSRVLRAVPSHRRRGWM